jgi:hypothetical protein
MFTAFTESIQYPEAGSENGATGKSDVQGKAARERGQRASFNGNFRKIFPAFPNSLLLPSSASATVAPTRHAVALAKVSTTKADQLLTFADYGFNEE